ncbi:hypothetical protein [Spirosoma horti]
MVAPVSEKAEITNNLAFPWARKVKVIARASLPNPVKMPDSLIFFKSNRGACCPLELIERDNGGSRRNGYAIPLPELQKIIWGLFEGYFKR